MRLALPRTLLIAALFAGMVSAAAAEVKDDGPIARDPVRPAVGDWAGNVSWNEFPVTYAWRIYPDGAFSSGRLGRGENGGGAWSSDGPRLTLKYSDGFRYDGEVRENAYAGTAYRADGSVYGSFSMSRDVKQVGAPLQ